jgi:hypothetical protein
MQPDKNIHNDLEYLSELGYKEFPGAENDLEALKQKIKVRAKENFFSSAGFMALMIGLFIGITCFFTIYNSPVLSSSHFELLAEQTRKEVIREISLDTVAIAAHVKKTAHEKFAEPAHLDSSLVFGKAEQLDIINEISVAKDIDPGDADLKFSPNAPYIFLYDLKVANYNGYYFNTPKRIIVHGGLDANKDSKYAQDPGTQMPYREYYLHDVIKEAMHSYKEGKFAACISKLDLVSDFSKNDVNCDFYRGMSYYNLGNNAQAYAFFSATLSNPVNVFIEEASFYKALSASKLGKEKEAKELLSTIAGNKGFYSKKAEEQLGK